MQSEGTRLMALWWHHLTEFGAWCLLWLFRIGMAYGYCHFVRSYARDWEEKFHYPPWKIYGQSLWVAVLVTAFIGLITYGGKKGWFDGTDEDGYEHSSYDESFKEVTLMEYATDPSWLLMLALTSGLSVCIVYRRHAPPVGTSAAIAKDPRTYIGILVGGLLVSYWITHDGQYVSWNKLLECYEERLTIEKRVTDLGKKHNAHYKEFDSRDAEERLRDFHALGQLQRDVNREGHAWMARCYSVQFKFSADHSFSSNGKWNPWKFHVVEEY
jgi:hypothetical protein